MNIESGSLAEQRVRSAGTADARASAGPRARHGVRRLAALGVGAGAVAAVFAQAAPAGGREALSGQCGVDEYVKSFSINSDAQLSMSIVDNGKSRKARFRFFGGNNGSAYYYWDYYQYRYGVTATNYGPQSNENVRFGQQRNDPNGPYWYQYNSPDNHNSNLGKTAPIQFMSSRYYSPAGNTEIWTRAIFDVPDRPDPSCWTNAIATK